MAIGFELFVVVVAVSRRETARAGRPFSAILQSLKSSDEFAAKFAVATSNGLGLPKQAMSPPPFGDGQP